MNTETANLIQSLESSSKQVEESFGKLSESQLNWKPAPDRWGVGECLEHLIKGNRLYFIQFEKIAKGEHKNSIWQSVSPFSGFFGNFLVKAVSPDNVKKVKAAAVFKPSRSLIPLSIVSEFSKTNDELSSFIKKFEGIDIKKIKITSPVAGFITYSLENTLKLLTIHEQRHINQAKRVMETDVFPKL
ncbi:MAG: DinB family protein [Chlorobi bacterium]|nr:DinB family protein [Chlorobiota bacterium]MCI0716251.1 DinB family protein [Chlorobiota bacterium]